MPADGPQDRSGRPAQADAYSRLAGFQDHHPEVDIRPFRLDPGTPRWDATVPLPRDGCGYYSPRPLGDLLDVLEEELDGPP